MHDDITRASSQNHDGTDPDYPWPNADDADRWGQLAQIIEAHPEYSDAECTDLIRCWITIGLANPRQADLYAYWQRRWKKQHYSLLEYGFSQTGEMSWSQTCRYLEVWSACRRIMPPFCGIAECLLFLFSNRAIKHRPALSRHFPQPRANSTTTANKASSNARQSELLIVSPYASVEEFSEFGASRQLLSALARSGFPWSLKQPWHIDFDLDPAKIRAVIFWSYRHRRNAYTHHAMILEKACHSLNIPVFNSVLRGWDTRHSSILRSFKNAGITCPQFEKFNSVDDIKLPYPLILRVDGIHRGQQMHLVKDATEARELVQAQHEKFLASTGRGARVWPAPNLAVEFIDIADKKGFYHKRRAYVIGSELVLRHHIISKNWLVNFASSAEISGEALRVHQDFMRARDTDTALLIRAGEASGSSVVALDYSLLADGTPVFWEANRHFRMNGDSGYDLPEFISETKGKKRHAKDSILSDALLKILREQFGGEAV